MPKLRRTSQAGIDLIKRFEGLRLTAYKDSAGIWTIGYGHTGNVSKGQRLTEKQAEVLLKQDLKAAEHYVRRTKGLKQHEFDALVSLTFNIGGGAFLKSTLRKKLEAGQKLDVPAEFLKWRKAGGRVLKGLLRRRIAEAALFVG